MFTSNYFYDLPKELQQKTLMTCIEIEIKERIAQRVENIKDNIEYKEIFTRILGFQDTYGLISYNRLSRIIDHHINIIYTSKDLDCYWDVLLTMNCDMKIFIQTSCYLNYLPYTRLLELCLENGIYTKNDLYWSHNKHTMFVQLLKI
jgi:hypothetical protein